MHCTSHRCEVGSHPKVRPWGTKRLQSLRWRRSNVGRTASQNNRDGKSDDKEHQKRQSQINTRQLREFQNRTINQNICNNDWSAKPQITMALCLCKSAQISIFNAGPNILKRWIFKLSSQVINRSRRSSDYRYRRMPLFATKDDMVKEI